MLKAFINVFKVKELRDRVLFTAGIIVLVRIAAAIPCPGVNPEALQQYLAQLSAASDASGTVMSFFNMFSGGALEKFAIGTLGIMPYITASIIMQLLVPVVPSLEKICTAFGITLSQLFAEGDDFVTLTESQKKRAYSIIYKRKG